MGGRGVGKRRSREGGGELGREEDGRLRGEKVGGRRGGGECVFIMWCNLVGRRVGTQFDPAILDNVKSCIIITNCLFVYLFFVLTNISIGCGHLDNVKAGPVLSLSVCLFVSLLVYWFICPFFLGCLFVYFFVYLFCAAILDYVKAGNVLSQSI